MKFYGNIEHNLDIINKKYADEHYADKEDIKSTNLLDGEGEKSLEQVHDTNSWNTTNEYVKIAIKDHFTTSDGAIITGHDNIDSPDITVNVGAYGKLSTMMNGKSQTVGGKSHAEGSKTIAFENNSHAEGNETFAAGKHSHAEGNLSSALGNASHTEGVMTVAQGDFAHAEGQIAKAEGVASHAEGTETQALELNSHAEGQNSIAYGINSHAEGTGAHALETAAHAEGTSSTASGTSAHAEGSDTVASKEASHAEGIGSTATGAGAHAEGVSADATDEASHAEGYDTTASGRAAHAEGGNTTASEQNSHAEGEWTQAKGYSSHAEGGYTEARGPYNHVSGFRNISDGDYQTVIGKANKVDSNKAFIIGNGEIENDFTVIDSNRANAMSVDWQGNVEIAGTIKTKEIDNVDLAIGNLELRIGKHEADTSTEIRRLDKKIETHMPELALVKGTKEYIEIDRKNIDFLKENIVQEGGTSIGTECYLFNKASADNPYNIKIQGKNETSVTNCTINGERYNFSQGEEFNIEEEIFSPIYFMFAFSGSNSLSSIQYEHTYTEGRNGTMSAEDKEKLDNTYTTEETEALLNAQSIELKKFVSLTGNELPSKTSDYIYVNNITNDNKVEFGKEFHYSGKQWFGYVGIKKAALTEKTNYLMVVEVDVQTTLNLNILEVSGFFRPTGKVDTANDFNVGRLHRGKNYILYPFTTEAHEIYGFYMDSQISEGNSSIQFTLQDVRLYKTQLIENYDNILNLKDWKTDILSSGNLIMSGMRNYILIYNDTSLIASFLSNDINAEVLLYKPFPEVDKYYRPTTTPFSSNPQSGMAVMGAVNELKQPVDKKTIEYYYYGGTNNKIKLKKGVLYLIMSDSEDIAVFNENDVRVNDTENKQLPVSKTAVILTTSNDLDVNQHIYMNYFLNIEKGTSILGAIPTFTTKNFQLTRVKEALDPNTESLPYCTIGSAANVYELYLG